MDSGGHPPCSPCRRPVVGPSQRGAWDPPPSRAEDGTPGMMLWAWGAARVAEVRNAGAWDAARCPPPTASPASGRVPGACGDVWQTTCPHGVCPVPALRRVTTPTAGGGGTWHIMCLTLQSEYDTIHSLD